MSALPKTFDPASIETKWYAHWESTGAFRPHRPDAEPFTIVNPPPNVTGSLHMGHALDNTLQDILIRHARMQGKDALWVVGTDHAGIATQMVVERQMEARQDKRSNYSREAFVDKVWEWKAESGGTITTQLRRLGCSMDWSREQFTMDPHFTKAVVKVFVDLYNQGLIYRDKRLVNWDPKLKTAISDLEVETREMKGGFWHFKYPLADGVRLENGADHIVVATTRPETMLADMAVAVNAADARYKSVIGKEILQPITGRRLRIVADEHADPELGSGAVKITPGHDFNDFEVGKRAGIKASDMLNMFDAEANVVQTSDGLIPPEFIGLHRFRKDGIDGARELVVQQMKKLDLLVRHEVKNKNENQPGEYYIEEYADAEDRTIQTPFGDRGGVVIEPWLTDQWYVDAEKLAVAPIAAVKSGAIEIVPKSWEKTFFNWMENIQPWCVSRQLWWGHRIPAWVGPHKKGNSLIYESNFEGESLEVFVCSTEEEAIEKASKFYELEVVIDPNGVGTNEIPRWQMSQESNEIFYGRNFPQPPVFLKQDSDVLDTWFSSALWPFATLGWPETPSPLAGEERDLARNDLSRSGEGASAGAESFGAQTRADPSPQPSPARGEGDAGGSLLTRHYPNNILISGFDILFFWDARMAMQGMHFMGEAPWKTLYLHGLVRAADGSKMSKSKGNTVDPLIMMDQYGTDALRFFMAAMESQGRDIKMDEKRVEGYRNFATKLWNAARFCQANGIGASRDVKAPEATLAVNRWIIGEVVETLDKLNRAFEEYRFDGMADAIYHFAWGTFCDWYLELVKPILSAPLPFRGGAGGGEPGKESNLQDLPVSPAPHPNPSPEGEGLDATETRAVAAWIFDQILVMLHPFMPFITEELWEKMGDRGGNLLIHAKWPEPAATIDPDARDEVNWLIDAISALRAAKNEAGISPGQRLTAYVTDNAPNIGSYIGNGRAILDRVGRLDIVYPEAPPAGAAMRVSVPHATLVIPLEGTIDLDAERARLTKAIEAVSKEAASLSGRLNNPAFVEKAKPEAVEKARADMSEKTAEVERLTAALARLG